MWDGRSKPSEPAVPPPRHEDRVWRQGLILAGFNRFVQHPCKPKSAPSHGRHDIGRHMVEGCYGVIISRIPPTSKPYLAPPKTPQRRNHRPSPTRCAPRFTEKIPTDSPTAPVPRRPSAGSPPATRRATGYLYPRIRWPRAGRAAVARSRPDRFMRIPTLSAEPSPSIGLKRYPARRLKPPRHPARANRPSPRPTRRRTGSGRPSRRAALCRSPLPHPLRPAARRSRPLARSTAR
jgi:hypothetical protein